MEQAKWKLQGKNVQLFFLSSPTTHSRITYRYSGLVVPRNSIKKEKGKVKKPAKTLSGNLGHEQEFLYCNDGYWYTEHLERILEEIANFCKRKSKKVTNCFATWRPGERLYPFPSSISYLLKPSYTY